MQRNSSDLIETSKFGSASESDRALYLSNLCNGMGALKLASKCAPTDSHSVVGPQDSIKFAGLYGASVFSVMDYADPGNVNSFSDLLESHYKGAMKGDTHAQEFLKDIVKGWEQVPAQSPLRQNIDKALAQLGSADPEAAAFFRKGIATGDVDFKNEATK